LNLTDQAGILNRDKNLILMLNKKKVEAMIGSTFVFSKRESGFENRKNTPYPR
jgi:hypothetical protein